MTSPFSIDVGVERARGWGPVGYWNALDRARIMEEWLRENEMWATALQDGPIDGDQPAGKDIATRGAVSKIVLAHQKDL